MKIALGDDPSADGRERAAFRAVDLVDAVALSDRSTFMSAREFEILREHVAWDMFVVAIPITGRAKAEATVHFRPIARVIAPATSSNMASGTSHPIVCGALSPGNEPSGHVGRSWLMCSLDDQPNSLSCRRGILP